MNFLLTNDDGIDAPGMNALAEAMAALGEITIVAPDRPFSGCSHQATTQDLIRVEKRGAGRFAVSGSPADCVRLGLLHFAEDADWVLSGVNDGGNLGVDVYLSGTVAAAREAALFGRPAMALSQYRRGDGIDWRRAGDAARHVFSQLLEHSLSPGAFWNVNFPHWDVAHENGEASSQSIVFAELDLNPLPVAYDVQDDGYLFRSDYHNRPRKDGSDVDVCFRGRTAVTEIHPAGVARPTWH
ncbi:MAG: 5'/3'-nucleotidase SurE [Planctomycetes bacterium]|nr:5'/3'-nucleotidase SurE [Planctomycetota bacterium]